jgi:capsular polysaccharide biosynthesis protein
LTDDGWQGRGYSGEVATGERVPNRSVLTSVRRQPRAVLVTVVLCVAVAAAATALQPRLYEATGSVLVSPVAFLDPTSSATLPELSDTVVALASSRAVLRRAAVAYADEANDPRTRARRLRQGTEQWMRDRVALRPRGTSTVIEVSATARSQDDALALAASEIASLRRFVDKARTGRARAGARPGIALVPVSEAAPRGRVSPTPVRNLSVGLIGGGLLGCLVALVVDRWRRRGTPQRVATQLGVPWLGTVSAAPGDAARAGTVLRRFLESLEGSARAGTRVALIAGSAPVETVAGVAEEAVGALNGRARRALLVQGDVGVWGIRRRLQKEPQRDAFVTHGGGGGRVSENESHTFGELQRPAALWLEYEFVVIGAPAAAPMEDVRAVVPAIDCLVLTVTEEVSQADLAAVRVLAQDALAARAAVGLLGVAEGGAAVSASS